MHKPAYYEHFSIENIMAHWMRTYKNTAKPGLQYTYGLNVKLIGGVLKLIIFMLRIFYKISIQVRTTHLKI